MNTAKEKTYLLLAITVLGGMLSFSLLSLRTQIPAADEMIFIRITQQLPKYNSHMVWYSIDGKTDPQTYLGYGPYFEDAYELPIWVHPPVANYVAYPFVKLLYSEDSDATIRKGVLRLRWVAWALIAFSILGATHLVRRRSKSSSVLFLSMLPLATSYILFTQWGNNWFYHDTFMLVFLVTALLMRGTKYEKFIYFPLALMVGSKIYALLFLIPFIFENKKTALCSLALIPYFIQSYFVTGNFFYSPIHWYNLGSFDIDFYNRGILGQLGSVIDNASKIIPFLIIVAAPFVYTVYRAVRKEASWFLPVLFAIASIFGLGWVTSYYQMLPMMIIGILITGEAAILYELREKSTKEEVVKGTIAFNPKKLLSAVGRE